VPKQVSRQAQQDIDGLAVPGNVTDDPAPAAVQFDQAIEQFQAPAGLVVGGCRPPRWPACGAVVDAHPQVPEGVRDADVNHHPVTVADGVGGQFADDQPGEVGVLAKAPSGNCRTGLLASVPDLGRLAAQQAAHGIRGDVRSHRLSVPT
jgi:hypothetical protein